jgi:Zn-dependent M16 (insulinase) family peptidase
MKNLLFSIHAKMIILQLKSVILFAMEPELQTRFEDHDRPREIIEELKTMFHTQARYERHAISEKFITCKMEEGRSVSKHTIKLTGYTQRLNQLDNKILEELKIERVLQSLPPS